MEYKSLPKYKFASVWWVCRAVKGLNEYLKSDFLSLLCNLRFIAATILNVGRDGLASLAKSLLAQQSKLWQQWMLNICTVVPSQTKGEFFKTHLTLFVELYYWWMLKVVFTVSSTGWKQFSASTIDRKNYFSQSPVVNFEVFTSLICLALKNKTLKSQKHRNQNCLYLPL